MAVQFAPLTALRTTHFGKVYDRLARGFPGIREMPPLERLNESFGEGGWKGEGVKFAISTSPILLPRLWFENEEGSQLIQFQRDRFAHNWRKATADASYPSFDRIFPAFKKNLRTLRALLRDERLGPFKPDMVEVIYVNTLGSNEIRNPHQSLGRMISPWSKRYSDGFFTKDRHVDHAETVSFVARHVIKDDAGEPAGRLHVSCAPTIDKQVGNKAVQLQLAVRLILDKATLVSVVENIQRAHDIIVRGFTSYTTTEMHKTWERTQ